MLSDIHGRVPLARWVALCAAAEIIGMTASSAAAKLSNSNPELSPLGGLALVVAGGLIEGLAVGTAQAFALRFVLPRLGRARWIVVTTLIAGVGWAAASAPAALSPSDDGTSPPILLIVAGALALGALMGAVLGAVQATGLRGLVPHPWRWIAISAAAWAVTMAIIFVGATTPDASWSFAAVVALGALTGALAGAALGIVSALLLPVTQGPTVANLAVMGILGSRIHGLLDDSLVVLRVRGSVTGRRFELPAQFAQDGLRVTVMPGRPQTKTWWHNLREPAEVHILLRGVWRLATGGVVEPGDTGYSNARATYHHRWPRIRVAEATPLVVLNLSEAVRARERP